MSRLFQVPQFPVFTRSGEVTVSIDLVHTSMVLTEAELQKLFTFHRTIFSNVLRLEKDPMEFNPSSAEYSYVIVPLNKFGELFGLFLHRSVPLFLIHKLIE